MMIMAYVIYIGARAVSLRSVLSFTIYLRPVNFFFFSIRQLYLRIVYNARARIYESEIRRGGVAKFFRKKYNCEIYFII